jgi:hypothetical protein
MAHTDGPWLTAATESVSRVAPSGVEHAPNTEHRVLDRVAPNRVAPEQSMCEDLPSSRADDHVVRRMSEHEQGGPG